MRIETEDDLTRALDALVLADPRLAAVRAVVGPVPLRRRPAGFRGLAWIVVGQQLSVASASAIWARLEAGVPLDPDRFAAVPDDALRAAGLSAPKIRTLRSLAVAVTEARIDLDALAACEADEARDRLVALPGIGPWTADLYLLACLGHVDAFPAGDLALQEAARLVFHLGERPDTAGLGRLAEPWRPFRGAAARLLWSFYRVAKGRDGAMPQ